MPPGAVPTSEPTTEPPPPSSDPAYPPAQPGPYPPPQPTAPSTTTIEMSEKPAELPAYSAPPPSYGSQFPDPQQQQQQQSDNPAYPPPAGTVSYQYAPAPPHAQTMVRTLGAIPLSVECPHCHQQVVSLTRFAPGLLTYIVVGTCLLFGGWFGCCLIPFCVDGLKDVYHTCPNCKAMIGRYDRLS